MCIHSKDAFEIKYIASYFSEIKCYIHTQRDSLPLLNLKKTFMYPACNGSVQKHNYLLLVLWALAAKTH